MNLTVYYETETFNACVSIAKRDAYKTAYHADRVAVTTTRVCRPTARRATAR
ncbi:hypothetical protein ACRAWD_13970 [Caulobacter segnis]